MKQLRRRLLTVFLLCGLFPQPLMALELTVVHSGVWPPYSDEGLPQQGLAIDLVTTALQRAGHQPVVRVDSLERILEGGKIGAEASLNKIFWSELDVKMHETALALLGARGQLLPEAQAAEGVGSWLDGYLFALSGPIYAGTNEIQRNVIAERILGLPRS